jgi:hypothetical protein
MHTAFFITIQTRRITVNEQHMTVIKKMNEFKVLLKTIRSSGSNNMTAMYFIEQLKKTKTCRPVKPVNEDEVDRNTVWDAEKREWYNREIKRKRGAEKETLFSKKQSTTLSSRKGTNTLFELHIDDSVGVMLDRERCDIKEKYVFDHNINSDQKPWLKRKDPSKELGPSLKAIPLDQLIGQIDSLETRGIAPPLNQLLAKLTKDALIGVFAVKNNLVYRCAALAMHKLIKENLQIDLPLFIKTEEGIVRYSEKQKLQDREQAFWQPPENPAHLYVGRDIDIGEVSKEEKSAAEKTNRLPRLPESISQLIWDYMLPDEGENIVKYFFQMLLKEKSISSSTIDFLNFDVCIRGRKKEDTLRIINAAESFFVMNAPEAKYLEFFHEARKKNFEVITNTIEIFAYCSCFSSFYTIDMLLLAALFNHKVFDYLIKRLPAEKGIHIKISIKKIREIRNLLEKYKINQHYWEISSFNEIISIRSNITENTLDQAETLLLLALENTNEADTHNYTNEQKALLHINQIKKCVNKQSLDECYAAARADLHDSSKNEINCIQKILKEKEKRHFYLECIHSFIMLETQKEMIDILRKKPTEDIQTTIRKLIEILNDQQFPHHWLLAEKLKAFEKQPGKIESILSAFLNFCGNELEREVIISLQNACVAARKAVYLPEPEIEEPMPDAQAADDSQAPAENKESDDMFLADKKVEAISLAQYSGKHGIFARDHQSKKPVKRSSNKKLCAIL